MTEFDQKDLVNWGTQQNAGGNIYNNSYSKSPWTPPMMLPPGAQSFVGRKEDLAWLLTHLQEESGLTLGICGAGGIGKTALVAKALADFIKQPEWLTRFPGGCFYHSFYAYPSLDVAFEEIARTFEEDPGADPRRAAIRALSRRRTILVFDGVETLEDSLPLRELGGSHIVLVLSRRRSDVPDPAHRLDLDLLSPQQGISLIQQLADPYAADLQSVKRLVHHIGGYPLALQLIGSYLSSRQEAVADYLQWFEEEGLAALDHGKHRSQSVHVLLQRSYTSLTSSEQDLFALLGLLAPVPFLLELVQDILQRPPRAIRQSLGSLVNVSVLRRSESGYEVSHPLVHTFAKENLLLQANTTLHPSTDTLASWQERLLTALATHFEQSDPYNRMDLALWQPHVFPLLSAQHMTDEQALRAAHLFNTVGFNASTQAKYAEAEPLLQRALSIREEQLGGEHLDTALGLNNLAELYWNQGRHSEAEPLFQRSLSIREEQLGGEHPDTALGLNNLAELYWNQGRYSEAEPLLQRALSIYEQQLGGEHPFTATSLNNLALLYKSQGRYSEAEPLYQRALSIREEQLGREHPDTAFSLHGLAELYQSQGRYSEAEPLYQRALSIREEQLGGKHPLTATSLNSLAGLYESQGRYSEAEPLYQRALSIREEQLGIQHPDTATSFNDLAILYSSQGRYNEAEPLYQRALSIREQQLGARHPETASSLNNLAILYWNQGRYSEAEPLLQRALSIREQQLGGEHPDTAQILNNLAELYRSQGRYSEAEPLLQRALSIREQQLGGRHPDTAQSLNNLATLYSSQGRYSEAEPLMQQALSIREQQLGGKHPDTAQILNNLAELYRSQGRHSVAEPLLQRALSICEQQLGAQHPNTAFILNNLAELYESQGRYSKAEPLYQQAVTISVQQLGMEHPQTQQMINNYLTLLAEVHTGGDLDALLRLLAQQTAQPTDTNEGLIEEEPQE